MHIGLIRLRRASPPRRVKLLGIVCGAVRVMADREWIWRGMLGDWQDEWDIKDVGLIEASTGTTPAA